MYCTNTLLPWSTCPTSRPMTELPRLLLLVTKGIFFSRFCAASWPMPWPQDDCSINPVLHRAELLPGAWSAPHGRFGMVCLVLCA